MQKDKKIYLLVLLIVISSILLVTGASFSTASSTQKFSDVNEENWFFSDVQYVHEKELMNGTSDITFAPNDSTTRGMIVTILWRLDGEPEATSKMSFTDVIRDKYYYDAVAWASAKEIVSGYDDTTFGPNDYITREQMVTMMCRYAQHKGYDIETTIGLERYSDSSNISEYSVSAFKWAITNGIITGTSDNTLSPQGEALRCQVAAILRRFCDNYIQSENTNAEPTEENKEPQSQGNVGGSSSSSSGNSSGAISTGNKPANDEKTDYSAIIVDSVEAKAGDEVLIEAKINKNPGILGMTLSAYYDDAVCTLVSVENGEAFEGILDFTTSEVLGNGARFVWDGIEISDKDVKDGTILIMKFRIKDNAVGGKYPITLKCADGDMLDNNISSISVPIESGYIVIN
ncbi:MAG: S-layer homology domain-containing protein [Clostridia bacterium]|nr:S-layer homology domain-containing protein [Clostridia bacterium]